MEVAACGVRQCDAPARRVRAVVEIKRLLGVGHSQRAVARLVDQPGYAERAREAIFFKGDGMVFDAREFAGQKTEPGCRAARLARRDRLVRGGEWAAARGLAPTVSGKRLGIIGLGAVGAEIARRAAAFDMTIAYHNRRRRDDVEYDYVESVAALAARSDYLIVSCPGGEATRHIVDADVLKALGPDGHVVHIARGSVVDTTALIAALENGAIAGAALDVFEDEPNVPDQLKRLDNVVLSPHVAGFTPEAFRAGFELLRDNLRAHFAGRELPTPVP